jgi:hypothetical protein
MRNVVSSLKRRHTPMRQFDRLPAELRAWLRHAALPWSAASALKLWQKALAQSQGDAKAACRRLDEAETRALARDAARIWGPGHPACTQPVAASGSTPLTGPGG